MRLRRMRHPIDVQLCDLRLRADQDEKRSLKLRAGTVGMVAVDR
ncbi:hypothetical protein SAMN05216215_105317 [Saccharopolyspora shandongensis]|uniref:Uncharacterized protein n=1 Tax=Saccharopolyspora shandongensis TaxID=418495 RepID=A0A1H3RB41_9PSEU|nr:hypothetical protein [Saccharopolyspora shandongensis]SDZ22860.1 hypothetical protein SAMN05216215_105317 [Saccharopolyspora shandongensis]